MNKPKPIPEKIIIYESSYGAPLTNWVRFMNKLWYYTADQNKLWAKLIYYPLDQLERQKINLERIHHNHFHKDKDDCYWYQQVRDLKER
jgi:hypothetical protein